MTELLRAEAPAGARAPGTDPHSHRPAWRRALPVLATAVAVTAFMAIVVLLMLGVIAPPGAAGGCGGG